MPLPLYICNRRKWCQTERAHEYGAIFMRPKWNLRKWTENVWKSRRTRKWKPFWNRLEKHINANSLKYASEILLNSSHTYTCTGKKKTTRFACKSACKRRHFCASPYFPLIFIWIFIRLTWVVSLVSVRNRKKHTAKKHYTLFFSLSLSSARSRTILSDLLTANCRSDVIWYDKIHVTFLRSICIRL